MSIIIDGNMIKGSLRVDAEIASDDFYNIAFTANSIDGDVIFKTEEINKDISINECDISTDLQHMSPEVWFMYHNIFIDKKNITKILGNYSRGWIDGLRFNLPFKPRLLMSEYTIGVVVRCLEFLKRYHNT